MSRRASWLRPIFNFPEQALARFCFAMALASAAFVVRWPPIDFATSNRPSLPRCCAALVFAPLGACPFSFAPFSPTPTASPHQLCASASASERLAWAAQTGARRREQAHGASARHQPQGRPAPRPPQRRQAFTLAAPENGLAPCSCAHVAGLWLGLFWNNGPVVLADARSFLTTYQVILGRAILN